MECKECYSEKNRTTPLLGTRECLENHLQYVCGTCGRCICIDRDKIRGLQRWNFPFKSLDIAKLYLRTADYINKKCCGIYEIENSKGRKSYKIFASDIELKHYLSKNQDKLCKYNRAVFSMNKYKEFNNTKKYLLEVFSYRLYKLILATSLIEISLYLAFIYSEFGFKTLFQLKPSLKKKL